MMEIVFGRTAKSSLQYAGKCPADIFCFDLELSIGKLSEKKLPDLAELRARAKNAEALRVWYSQDPDEMCGFYWLMEKLEDLEDIEIHGIPLPAYWEHPDGIVICWDKWEEVSASEWKPFLQKENLLPRNFRKGCAWEWQEMEKENAPLRAVINGKLCSASEHLYASFLRRNAEPSQHRKRP